MISCYVIDDLSFGKKRSMVAGDRCCGFVRWHGVGWQGCQTLTGIGRRFIFLVTYISLCAISYRKDLLFPKKCHPCKLRDHGRTIATRWQATTWTRRELASGSRER